MERLDEAKAYLLKWMAMGTGIIEMPSEKELE